MITLAQIQKRLDQKSGKKNKDINFEQIPRDKVTEEQAKKIVDQMRRGMEKFGMLEKPKRSIWGELKVNSNNMWPIKQITSNIKKKDKEWKYEIAIDFTKAEVEFQLYRNLGDKIVERIANDIYKGIRAEVLKDRKFRKAMLEKVILSIAKANKEEWGKIIK